MSKEQIAVLDMVPELPVYVKALPFEIKAGWMSAFNIASDLYGFERAVQVADSYALRKIKELKERPEPIADPVKEALMEEALVFSQSKEGEFKSFKLDAAKEQMISYSENGEIVLEAILADTNYSSDGFAMTDSALISMAEQINNNGLAMPDIEHQDYNAVLKSSETYDEFKTELKKKKGLLTKVKAFYNDGKLLIKAWLDKRYKKHTDAYKSLSIEARAKFDPQDSTRIIDAEPLSFTFTNSPKIIGASINNVY
jgi:hypothetical protein